MSVDNLLRQAVLNENVNNILLLCDKHPNKVLGFHLAGRRLCHFAAKIGSFELLKRLVQLDADLQVYTFCDNPYDDPKSYHNKTSLHIACKGGFEDLVTFILQHIKDTPIHAMSLNTGRETNAFYFAAKSGNINIIRCLINIGSLDINEILPCNKTALLCIVEEFDAKGAELLCQCGANIETGRLESRYSALQYLSKEVRGSETLKVLIAYGGEINGNSGAKSKPDSCINQTPLFIALEHGVTANAKILLDSGCNIGIKGKRSNGKQVSCFALAVMCCPSLIPDFVLKGSNPNEKFNGKPLLEEAILKEDHTAIEYLVKAGSDINYRQQSKTTLQRCNSFGAVKAFINAGIPIKVIEEHHKVSILSLAVDDISRYRLSKNVIPELTEQGANPNLVSPYRDSPLILAVRIKDFEVVEFLLKAGASVDHKGKDGNTAVHICCGSVTKNSLLILKSLIGAKASLNMLNNAGKVPLDLLVNACGSGENSFLQAHFQFYQSYNKGTAKEMVSLMLSNGANPNNAFRGQPSPLSVAMRNEMAWVVEPLLEARADILHVGKDKKTALDQSLKTDCNWEIKKLIFRHVAKNGILLKLSMENQSTFLKVLQENAFDERIMQLAITHGVKANEDMHVHGGESLLMTVMQLKRLDLACTLMKNGADISFTSKNGFTPFDIYASQLMKTLEQDDLLSLEFEDPIYHQLPVNPFHRESSEARLLMNFLTSGLKINMAAKNGVYPLHLAVLLRNQNLVTWIIEHGGDTTVNDKDMETPLTYAVKHRSIDIAMTLVTSESDDSNMKKEKISGNDSISETGHTDQKTIIYARVLQQLLQDSSIPCFQILALTTALLKNGTDPNLVKPGNDSLLIQAVRRQSPDIVKALLKEKANVNHQGKHMYTALHTWCEGMSKSVVGYSRHSTQILQMLLEHGASPAMTSSNNELPIHLFLKQRRNTKDIKTLLQQEFDINKVDNDGLSPLLRVASFCNYDIITEMLLKGANAKQLGLEGNNALHTHMDAFQVDPNILTVLVQNGADINALNDLGETPMIRLLKRSDQKQMTLSQPTYNIVTFQELRLKEILSLVVKLGANPHCSKEGYDSALIVSIRNNLYECFELLCVNGNVNHRGQNGRTALHAVFEDGMSVCRNDKLSSLMSSMYTGFLEDTEATMLETDERLCPRLEKDVKVIEKLMQNNAETNILTKDGISPLYSLIMNHGEEGTNRMLSHILTADIDPNLGSKIPLTAAALHCRTKAIKMLLKRGAMVDKTDDKNDTALTTVLAVCCEKQAGNLLETVQILIEAGASVNHTNQATQTPLSLVLLSYLRLQIPPYRGRAYRFKIASNVVEILSLLLEKGSDPNLQISGADSCLFLAVQTMEYEIVEKLLQFQADVLHIGKDQKSIVQTFFTQLRIQEHARFTEKDSIFYLLMKHKADPNQCVKGDDSPLLMAIKGKHVDAVEKLVNAGADITHRGANKADAFGESLKLDIESCLLMMDVLLKVHESANLCKTLFPKLWNVLKDQGQCIKTRNALIEEVVLKILFWSETSVELSKSKDDSPLIFFCWLQSLPVVKALLELGANIDHVGRYGKTAMHYIATETNMCPSEWFDVLLQYNPRLDIEDKNRRTALDLAFFGYISEENKYVIVDGESPFNLNPEVLVYLLKAGAAYEFDIGKVLLKAAKHGHFSLMLLLIQKGANVNSVDIKERTAIHLCWQTYSRTSGIDEWTLRFLKAYVEAGGCLTSRDAKGSAPIMQFLTSCSSKHSEDGDKNIAEVVSFFITHGSVDVKDSSNCTPLHKAAEKGLLSSTDMLLKAGADVFSVDNFEKTPLHYCLENQNPNTIRIVEKLLVKAKPSEFHKCFGDNILYMTQSINKCDQEREHYLIKLLIKYGANPNVYVDGCVPLIKAVERLDFKTTEVLLNHEADISKVDSSGNTALHVLARAYNTENTKETKMKILHLLLKSGINVNAVNRQGNSAVMEAVLNAEHNKNHFVEELIANSANLNIRSHNNKTVLSIVCNSGENIQLGRIVLKGGANPERCLQIAIENIRGYEDKEIEAFLCELVKEGADPNIFDRKGSCLIEAAKMEYADLVETLCRFGSDVNVTDSDEKTAVFVACCIENARKRNDIVRVLIENRCDLNIPSSHGLRCLDALLTCLIKEMNSGELLEGNKDGESCVRVDISLFYLLVQSGSDLCPAEFHSGGYERGTEKLSVLQKLLQNGLIKSAMYLIKSGWDLKREAWFENFDVSTIDIKHFTFKSYTYDRLYVDQIKSEFDALIESFNQGPKSLSILCRETIRKRLVERSEGQAILTSIDQLTVPTPLKSIIRMSDIAPDDEVIYIDTSSKKLTEPDHSYAQYYPAVLLRQMLAANVFNPFGILPPGFIHVDSDEYDDYDYGDTDYYYSSD